MVYILAMCDIYNSQAKCFTKASGNYFVISLVCLFNVTLIFEQLCTIVFLVDTQKYGISCLVIKAKKSKSCIKKIFANIFVYIIILLHLTDVDANITDFTTLFQHPSLLPLRRLTG